MAHVLLLTVLLVFGMVNSPLLACWMAPAEFRIQSVPRSDFFLRNIKSKKTVEIRKSGDLELSWKVEIEDYNALFSSFRLTRDGEFLIHIKGNHLISDADQVCVTVYGKSGYTDSYKVRELRGSVPKNKAEIQTCMSPSHVWHTEVNDPLDDKMFIKLDEKNYAWVYIGTHKAETHRSR